VKKPEPTRSSKKRGLTDDDIELWHHTAQSLKPLPRSKSRVRDAAGQPGVELDEPRPRIPEKPKAEPPIEAKSKAAGKTALVRVAVMQVPPPPSVAEFDRRNHKKLRKGRIELDGRIDLHGMRQGEAHVALRRFLLSSQAKGKRWVLVITGKGGPSSSKSDEAFGYSSQSERGVLKRSVPLWLEEPDIRAIIISFTEAAIEHGGTGALYVHLRKAVQG
jgi:DNA-nicking Smr family endonuclease